MDKSSDQHDNLSSTVHSDNQSAADKRFPKSSDEPVSADQLLERIRTLELLYRSEFKKVSESFEEFSTALNTLKSRLPAYVDNKLKLEINTMQEKIDKALNNTQIVGNSYDINKLEQDFNAEIAQIRNDLIDGIRLLGKRVTKAIETMDQRLDDFKDQLKNEIASDDPDSEAVIQFGEVKDASFVNNPNVEIISQKSLQKLLGLFHRQSESIRRFNDKQLTKLQTYEREIKSIEEEYNKKIHKLQDEMRTQTVVNIVLIIFLVILFMVVHYVL